MKILMAGAGNAITRDRSPATLKDSFKAERIFQMIENSVRSSTVMACLQTEGKEKLAADSSPSGFRLWRNLWVRDPGGE